METMCQIDQFEGKRNTVLTFVFTPKDHFNEKIKKICNWVSTIKHEYKKKQIQKSLNLLKNQTKTSKHFQPNGLIICCGYNKLGKIGYYELKIPQEYDEQIRFEYYYGYKFNTNRIKELLFSNLILSQMPTETQLKHLEQLETQIKNVDQSVVLGDKVSISLDQNLAKQIYYFSNDEITMDFIQQIQNSGAQLVLFDMNLVECREFGNKYGKLISILHFPVNIVA